MPVYAIICDYGEKGIAVDYIYNNKQLALTTYNNAVKSARLARSNFKYYLVILSADPVTVENLNSLKDVYSNYDRTTRFVYLYKHLEEADEAQRQSNNLQRLLYFPENISNRVINAFMF